MTNEEAIKDIRDNIKPIVGGKSLDMAIEALSAQKELYLWQKEMVKILSTQPKRKMGEWLCSDDMYETGICNSCGWDSGESWVNVKRWFKFCPHCGADMRGEENDEQ